MLDRIRNAASVLLGRTSPAALVRRFDGATGGRRGFGFGQFGRINSEVGAAGATLASRSAHLVENNPLLNNGVANLVGETIGTGLRPTPRHTDSAVNEEIGAAFDRWWMECDADARLDFGGLQAAIDRDVKVRGEAFAIFVETDDGLRVRQIDPEQVDRSMTRELDNGHSIIQGIELGADGVRIAYWIAPHRETISTGWAAPVRVEAADVMHVFRPVAPGQMRGIPWTTPVILAASEFDKLCDALLMSASVAAMFCAIVTDENALGGEDPFDGQAQPSLEPGSVLRVGGGNRVTLANPQQMQSAGEVIKVQIRGLAAGLGVPAFMLDGDLSQYNYSSLRAGLLPFRRRVEQYQYGVFIPQFLAPIWKRWLAHQYLSGEIEASEIAVEWIAPRALQVDPIKDVQALREMLDSGLMSRRQAVAEQGWDIEALDAEIAADREREAALGLSFGATAAKSERKKEETAE